MRLIIFDFLKGICIGIANVIPGFSGGTMAVILNIYERLIGGFSNFFRHPLVVLKDLWSILLGLIVGIVIAILTITKLIQTFPIPTALFFVGLIFGSIPNLFKTYKESGKTKIIDVIFFVIAIAIIVILPLLNSKNIEVSNINIGLIILMFVLGAICAAAMILPGVSGSLVLMAFGYYMFLMAHIGNLIEDVLSFSFDGFWNSFFLVLSFGVGAIVGIVCISKLLKFLFNKYQRIVYALILGLLVASPFAIIYSVINEYPEIVSNANVLTYVVSFFTMVLGIVLVILPNLINREQKNEEQN